jgi:hypothetical protein
VAECVHDAVGDAPEITVKIVPAPRIEISPPTPTKGC